MISPATALCGSARSCHVPRKSLWLDRTTFPKWPYRSLAAWFLRWKTRGDHTLGSPFLHLFVAQILAECSSSIVASLWKNALTENKVFNSLLYLPAVCFPKDGQGLRQPLKPWSMSTAMRAGGLNYFSPKSRTASWASNQDQSFLLGGLASAAGISRKFGKETPLPNQDSVMFSRCWRMRDTQWSIAAQIGHVDLVVSINRGTPKTDGFIMENPIKILSKWMFWGCPYFNICTTCPQLVAQPFQSLPSSTIEHVNWNRAACRPRNSSTSPMFWTFGAIASLLVAGQSNCKLVESYMCSLFFLQASLELPAPLPNYGEWLRFPWIAAYILFSKLRGK